MRAAVYLGPGSLAVEERPVPLPGPTDVIIEVSHCGICGSDLHFVLDGWGRPGAIEGHEYTGRIVAVGEAVTRWKVGDDVVGGPTPRCGECQFCRSGRPSLCESRDKVGEDEGRDGAFAEYLRMSEKHLLALPDGLSLRGAALAEPLAVALHALRRGGIQAGQRLFVAGAGPIGALAVAAARAQGVTDINVSEPSSVRRALAIQLGARAAAPDEFEILRSPYDLVAEPADVALECSGRADAMELSLAQLGRGGTLVLVGAGMKPPRFDPNRILLNELVITGSYVYDADGFESALALLADPSFPTEAMLDPDDVGLDDLLPAMQRLAAGEIAAKVLVAPRGGR